MRSDDVQEHAGRVALVTGASGGIGRATAVALAGGGAAVALVGRDPARLAETAQRIADAKGRASIHACDLTDERALAALPPAVAAALGPVDLLVNNAGVAESAPFLQTSRETWDRTLAVNLTAVFRVTQLFLPAMLQRGFGRVVHVASTAGKVGFAYVTAYCAAKHGVVGLTKALALEVAAKGVTINAVCPSYVDTPMTERSVANIAGRTGRSAAEARETLARMNPQQRLIAPEEVAAAVMYLCSEGARGVNGQAINVCGGSTPL